MLVVSLFFMVGQVTTWAKAYDRVFGQSSYNDTSYSIAADTLEDAYIIAGHTTDGPLGGIDILLFKVTADSGKIIWVKCFGTFHDDYARDITVDYTEGAYVIDGYTKPSLIDNSQSDALVLKVGLNGGLIWGWVYAGWFIIWEPQLDTIRLDEYLYAITVDGQGYIVAGNIEPGPCAQWVPRDTSDVLVFKVRSSDGSPLWIYAYSKVSPDYSVWPADYAYSVIEDQHVPGLFVVAGKTWWYNDTTDILVFKGKKYDGLLATSMWDYSIIGYPSAYAWDIKNDPVTGYVLTGDMDGELAPVFIMRLNTNLTPIWVRTYSFVLPALLLSHAILVDNGKNYVVCGSARPGNNSDLWVMKTNRTGGVIWSKVLVGCNNQMVLNDHGEDIVEYPDTTYAAVGYTEWPSVYTPNNILVAKMDHNGNINCPDTLDTCLVDLDILVDSPEVEVDSSWNYKEVELEWIPIFEDTAKIQDTVVCASWAPTGCAEHNVTDLRVYNIPNPFVNTTIIYFNVNVTSDVVISISDISGRLIRRYEFESIPSGTYTLVWDGCNSYGLRVPTGVYFCKLSVGDITITRKLVLLR